MPSEMKCLTIVLVPNAKSKLHKIKIPYRYLYIGLGAGAFVLFLNIFLVFRFISLSIQNDRLDSLIQENSHLVRVNTQMQNALDKIDRKIASIEVMKNKFYRILDMTPSEFGLGNIVSPSNFDRYHPESMVEKLNYQSSLMEKDFKQLEPKIKEQATRLASIPSIWPVYGYISSKYGFRIDPFTKKRTMHPGMDITGQLNTPIVATADGVVILLHKENPKNRRFDLGNVVYIQHRFGYETVYGHLNKIAVKTRQKVKRGDVIGYMGKSGRATGTHVHYEVRYHGVKKNPFDYMLDK